MNPIRRLIATLPILLVICLPFFFVGGPGFHSPRSFARVWDLGHIPYFCLFTLWLGALPSVRRLRPALRLSVLIALPFLTGYLFEWLQFLVNRRGPDAGDMFRNLLGSMLALCFLESRRFHGERRRTAIIAARGLALLILAVALYPTATALWDEFRARRQFPLLAGFESRFELSRWYYAGQLRPDKHIVRHGKRSARVQLSTAKYSGVTLHHFPHDWRGYKTLRFSAHNPLPGPLELNCRLDDALHRSRRGPYADRFNARFTLRPGWNDLAVSLEEAAVAPKDRSLDMSRIIGFGLFVVEQKQAIAIHLDNVHLE